MTANHENGKIEGESYFIKLTSNDNNIHGRELLCGISKNEDIKGGYYLELYNLKEKNMTKYETSNILGNIISDSFTIIKYPDESNSIYYYIFTYIVCNSNKYYLKIKKTYFSFDLNEGYKHVIDKSTEVKIHRMVSCFYTEKLSYICIYLNINYQLKIEVYNLNFSISAEIILYEEMNYGNRLFFKGIHLKKEIGFFIYFKPNINYPTISIFQLDDDKSLTPFSNFERITVDKSTFDYDDTRNDIIKLNDFQICFISCSIDKIYFKFVIFTLYKNDTLMNIRYYQIEIWTNYNMKIFCDIRGGLYKNFISLGFSCCPNLDCSNPFTDFHYASLIIFSYPNSSDNSLDIIPHLYETNRNIENDFSFNLEGTLRIENNLFGFTFKGTRIMNYPIGLKLTNVTNGNFIEVESIILKDENVSLYFEKHDNYKQQNYVVEYAYVLEEPNYEYLKNYYSNIEDSKGNQINDENDYYKKYEYTGKSSDFAIIIKKNLITNCNDDSCSLCFTNYTCITCKYNYTFNNNNKICFPKPLKPTTTQNLSQCAEFKIEGFEGEKLSSEQIKILYNLLKERISCGENVLIHTVNVNFQLLTYEEIDNNNNQDISSIDLGECEHLLKKQEGLSEDDYLIILKLDIKNEDLSSIYVQHEVYNPVNLKKLSLDICENIYISISIPANLDDNTKYIYNSLYNSGYNLFDLNDSFYNDICSTYTTENGTDLTLADRKNLIYDNNNISLCQISCTFELYNLTTNRAKCNCYVQKEELITDISKLNFDKELFINSFFITLKNSNFLVLKCFKLVFSKKGQINNIGSYIMSTITFIFIVFMFIYIINDNKKIKYYIEMILKEKLNCTSINKANKDKSIKKQKIGKKESKNKRNNKLKIIKKKNKLANIKSQVKSSDKVNVILNFPPKKNINLNCNNNIIDKNIDISMNPSSKELEKSKSVRNLLYIKKKDKESKRKKNNILLPKFIRNLNIKSEKLNTINKMYLENKKLNDEETNSLEYEIAIIIDKRTYFQYYISLLKKKHLILFSFYPTNDYNLRAVKISLFLLSFSLYFTINGFFFSDKTMNKINEDNGAYNFIFQIPQIVYSTIASSTINILLKRLSLSEKQILKIKLEKNYSAAKNKSKKINMYIKIKLIIFFTLSFMLMIFFWYFISYFCAVYKNTQIILIKDTLISFALSMIYPFGLNLIPGFFRIPALRAQRKDKKCLYKASGFIALI